MSRMTASCGSIFALVLITAGCSGHAKTTIRRETMQTVERVPGDPVVVKKKTTIESGVGEQRTTETRETEN